MSSPRPLTPDPHLPSFHAGTVGWGYEQWKGVFYPESLNSRQYLSHYAEYFDSVEVDSTFYGTPPAERVTNWAQSVPADFVFCPKTPQQITHDFRLTRPELMQEFVAVVQGFGRKLGAILIQLPPDFTTAEGATLVSFLSALPMGVRYAVEFRHLSWDNPQTAGLLRRFNVCWAAADYTIMPKKVVPTADFQYVRFLGRHGRYQTKDRELRDPTPELQWWIEAQLRPQWDAWEEIYVYFNNDYAGYSPASCNNFKRLLGLDADHPRFAVQGTLF